MSSYIVTTIHDVVAIRTTAPKTSTDEMTAWREIEIETADGTRVKVQLFGMHANDLKLEHTNE